MSYDEVEYVDDLNRTWTIGFKVYTDRHGEHDIEWKETEVKIERSLNGKLRIKKRKISVDTAMSKLNVADVDSVIMQHHHENMVNAAELAYDIWKEGE